MSITGTRIGLSMKDVDQENGRDLTPHLRIKSEAETDEERQRAVCASGPNAVPLWSKDGPTSIRLTKCLTSLERWELKQLISSGAIDASEYLEFGDDFNNPVARAEVEEELDVKVKVKAPFFGWTDAADT